MTQTVSAVTALVKHPSESILFAVDFTEILGTAETLSGTPTVTEPTGDLTLSAKAVNTATVVDDEGNTIAIGKAVQFRCVGGTAGNDYTITVSCGTSESDTRVGICKLYVRSS